MRVLLDTHVLLWWVAEPARLSSRARQTLEDGQNALIWSAASTWELAIKVGLGLLTLTNPVPAFLTEHMAAQAIESLLIEHRHAWGVADLPHHHRDPFDRLLVSQALAEDVPIVSGDRKLDAYGVRRIW